MRTPFGFSLRNVELTRDRNLHGIEGTAMRFALGFVDADPLGEVLRSGILVEDQIKTARGRTPDRSLAPGGYPKRRIGFLGRGRLHDNVFEAPETAAMRK